MELLTVDYFTFTAQQTHGHVNTIGGIKQTLSDFLMAHHGYAVLAKTEAVKLFGSATGNVLLQQSTNSMKRLPCFWLYQFDGALTMCLLLLYVLTFKYTTCSTFIMTPSDAQMIKESNGLSVGAKVLFPLCLLEQRSQVVQFVKQWHLDAVEQQKRVGGRRGKFSVHVRGVSVIP